MIVPRILPFDCLTHRQCFARERALGCSSHMEFLFHRTRYVRNVSINKTLILLLLFSFISILSSSTQTHTNNIYGSGSQVYLVSIQHFHCPGQNMMKSREPRTIERDENRQKYLISYTLCTMRSHKISNPDKKSVCM